MNAAKKQKGLDHQRFEPFISTEILVGCEWLEHSIYGLRAS
ncbi:hypothetical protein BOTU111921_05605 [Bordetella tumbae]